MSGGDFVPGRYLAPGYVITSRGCPNRCWFCSVWRREGALREFQAALVSLPNEASLFAAIVYVQRRLGMWEESRISLERATELNPNNLFDQSQFTRYLMALLRYDEALRRAERMAEIVRSYLPKG